MIGQPVRRREDARLLCGRGRFVHTVRWPGMVELAVLRSPHAHARIRTLDLSRARCLPGVLAALAAADLPQMEHPLPLPAPHPALRGQMPRPLARDVVRYVGEPVAIVVAENRYLAEDALDQIEVVYEPLPAVVDPAAALDKESPLVHPGLGSNLAAEVQDGMGNVEGAFANADVVVRQVLRIGRCSPQPLEPRGIAAKWDPDREELLIYDATQSPHIMRRFLADILGLSEERIRLIAPDIGGGFGGKNRLYPEEVLVCQLAMLLRRPVRWLGDRQEELMTMYQEREQVHDAELALNREGRILGLRVQILHDAGAYTPFGIVVPLVTASLIPGPYRVPAYRYTLRVVYTHKTPSAPYRGAGQPQACLVMERLLDTAARRLGLDPVQLRHQNLLSASDMPYEVGLRFLGEPMVFEACDPRQAMQQAVAALDCQRLRQEQAEWQRAGLRRRLGIGVANYMEATGAGSYEGARVKVDPDGAVHVYVGSSSQGQGHETSLAQICAERLGVPLAAVRVVVGDTGLLSSGQGTWASRTAVMAGNAVAGAAQKVRGKALRLAAAVLEADAADLELVDGKVCVRGAPHRAVSLGELVRQSSGLRFQLLRDPEEPFAPGLEDVHWHLGSGTIFANGCHAVAVELDLDTCSVVLRRYVVAHECGVMINPLIVDGQVQGGIAQGLGGALLEEMVYNPEGQLLTRSFLDYLLPTAAEVPKIDIHHLQTRSTRNAEGFKGAGEGAIVPVAAAIASAIEDALGPDGTAITQLPITPDRLWQGLYGESRPRAATNMEEGRR